MVDSLHKRVAHDAVEAGAKILKKWFGQALEIHYKGEIDLVTQADTESEEAILEVLLGHFPDHQILTEEEGSRGTNGSHKWIVDPLDGTVNFAHGYPVFCISLALEVDGAVQYGLVYDPLREELFAAEKGRGATVNGRPISVSHTAILNESLLCTGFPYNVRENSEIHLKRFNRMILKTQAIRRDGAAALDLCYVAVGRFDGFWELGLAPWDVAAASLITSEAGGRTSDFTGKPLDIYRGEILASNGKIHEEMIETLKG